MIDTARRNAGLKQMLLDRRRQLQDDVQRRIRDGRTDHLPDVRDYVERCDADTQEAIDLALLQLRAETLMRVDEALVRLDRGKYGFCLQCNGEISERRLRALPFAVRCQACEQKREQDGHSRQDAPRRRGISLFPDATT